MSNDAEAATLAIFNTRSNMNYFLTIDKSGDEMNYFLTMLEMIPSIVALVKHVETAIPGAGQGANKLAMVLNTVNAAASASPAIVAAAEGHDLQGTIIGITNAAVRTLNASGVFKK